MVLLPSVDASPGVQRLVPQDGQPGQGPPLHFRNGHHLGLKVTWTGAGGQMPDTVKAGFNLKEFSESVAAGRAVARPCTSPRLGSSQSNQDNQPRPRVTVLIVEQKVREVLKIAERVYVLRNGRVSFSGLAADLKDDAKLREVYL